MECSTGWRDAWGQKVIGLLARWAQGRQIRSRRLHINHNSFYQNYQFYRFCSILYHFDNHLSFVESALWSSLPILASKHRRQRPCASNPSALKAFAARAASRICAAAACGIDWANGAGKSTAAPVLLTCWAMLKDRRLQSLKCSAGGGAMISFCGARSKRRRIRARSCCLEAAVRFIRLPSTDLAHVARGEFGHLGSNEASSRCQALAQAEVEMDAHWRRQQRILPLDRQEKRRQERSRGTAARWFCQFP